MKAGRQPSAVAHKLASCVLAAALLLPTVAQASQVRRDVSKLPPGVDIIENLCDHVPRDLVFRDQNGKQVKLGDFLGDGKPVLLTLVYYKCAMLCSL